MNLLEMICKELGVGIEEEWLGSDGNEYKFDKQGNLLKYYKLQLDWLKEPYSVSDIVKGELKPVWKPKLGGFYWTIEFDEEDKVYQYMWHNEEADQRLLERGLVFKTEEEAIAAANKMLEVIKE